jgi:hypothetical protein
LWNNTHIRILSVSGTCYMILKIFSSKKLTINWRFWLNHYLIVLKLDHGFSEKTRIFLAKNQQIFLKLVIITLAPDIHTRDVIDELLKGNVVSEKDFLWKSKPRY